MRPFLAILVVAIAVSGCGVDPPGHLGCVKDTDCKGQRVCSDGMCADPPPPAGGAAGGAIPDVGDTGSGGSSPASPDGGPQSPAGDDAAATMDPAEPSVVDAAAPDATEASPERGSSADSGQEAPTAGGAVGKLCNQLSRGAQTVTVTVELGSAPNLVRISAVTATCSPPVGMPCTPIPTGAIPYRLLDGTDELDRGILPVRAGDEILLFATLNATSGAPALIGNPLPLSDKCSDVYFEPTPGQ